MDALQGGALFARCSQRTNWPNQFMLPILAELHDPARSVLSPSSVSLLSATAFPNTRFHCYRSAI